MADPSTYINRWPDISANLSLGVPALTLHNLERQIESWQQATTFLISVDLTGSVSVTTEASDHAPGRATSGNLSMSWSELFARDQDWDKSLSDEFTQRFFRLRESGIFNRFPDLDTYELDADSQEEVVNSITSGSVSWNTRVTASASTSYSGRWGPDNLIYTLTPTWLGQSTISGDVNDACPGITNLINAANGSVIITPRYLLTPGELFNEYEFAFSGSGNGTYGVDGEFSYSYTGSMTTEMG